MKKIIFRRSAVPFWIFLCFTGICLSCQPSPEIEDEEGVLSRTSMPLEQQITLPSDMKAEAEAGQLGFKISGAAEAKGSVIPVQWSFDSESKSSTAVAMMPILDGSGKVQLELAEQNERFTQQMVAAVDKETGQVFIREGGKPVLRYAYETVYESDKYAFHGMEPNEYAGRETDTLMANPSIYAVPRSNYIHPIFGPYGEILTRDWSRDHPHHRGIYWAWPEVDFGSKRSDLHALQKVFARPTGRIKLESGPVYAQVEAENLWLMEEGMVPIAREVAMIRAYHQTEEGRVIDLAFKFIGLKDSVTLARRGTNAYGGLNVRMMTPESQEISFHTDEEGATPRRAWSDLSGKFTGADGPSGMMVFQHQSNPEYPGEWVQYPDLSWVQPTFPTAGTRYLLKPGEPLILRFRLVVHPGAKPDEAYAKVLWNALHSEFTPEPDFEL
jgi:hypothetical protein